MSNHIVETYDEELRELHLLIAYMGKNVSTALETTCNDLVKGPLLAVHMPNCSIWRRTATPCWVMEWPIRGMTAS